MRGPGWRILLFVTTVALLAACERRAAPPDVSDPADRPDQESWDVDLMIEMDGRPRARLVAPYLARFERADTTLARFGPTQENPARVLADVFDAEGELSATVEADRLVYYENQRTFIATGNVVVESVTDRMLEGERLTWDEAARELRSDGFVRITTPTERLQGYQLVADETLETYRLARITGQIEVEDI